MNKTKANSPLNSGADQDFVDVVKFSLTMIFLAITLVLLIMTIAKKKLPINY